MGQAQRFNTLGRVRASCLILHLQGGCSKVRIRTAAVTISPLRHLMLREKGFVARRGVIEEGFMARRKAPWPANKSQIIDEKDPN